MTQAPAKIFEAIRFGRPNGYRLHAIDYGAFQVQRNWLRNPIFPRLDASSDYIQEAMAAGKSRN